MSNWESDEWRSALSATTELERAAMTHDYRGDTAGGPEDARD